MRKIAQLFGMFFLLGSTNIALAQSNPQARVCRLADGSFLSVEVPHDQIGFCQFGSALIGSEGLLRAQDGLVSAALDLYISGHGIGVNLCEDVMAQEVLAESFVPSSDLRLCQFHDGSWIAFQTLAYGKTHPQNFWLNQGLRNLGLMH